MSSSSFSEKNDRGAIFGYEFRDAGLLERALTHRSLRADSNERLEFLGDAVLSLVIAEYLFSEYRRVDEGAMTRMRVHIVCGDALYECASQTELPQRIVTGGGVKAPGHSIIADAAEAVFAAVYLDGGLTAARRVILDVMRPRIATAAGARQYDPKTRINEYFLRSGVTDVLYEDIGEEGPDHDKVFRVRLCAGGRAWGEGAGHSKKQAQQEAARRALALLNDLDL